MARSAAERMVMNGDTWRIGDIICAQATETAPEPWPERKAGEAFWYVAHTMAGCERRLAADIVAAGFSSYVPMRKTLTRRPGRKVVKKTLPLFPRYVFFEIVPDPRCWAAIRALRDLSGILTLTNDSAPARVSDESIGDLMAAEDMQMFDSSVTPNAIEIISRDQVTIVAGAWQGYEAIVKSSNGRRARVQVVSQGKPRDVVVPLDLLRILA